MRMTASWATHHLLTRPRMAHKGRDGPRVRQFRTTAPGGVSCRYCAGARTGQTGGGEPPFSICPAYDASGSEAVIAARSQTFGAESILGLPLVASEAAR